jgi:hypothetical protein
MRRPIAVMGKEENCGDEQHLKLSILARRAGMEGQNGGRRQQNPASGAWIGPFHVLPPLTDTLQRRQQFFGLELPLFQRRRTGTHIPHSRLQRLNTDIVAVSRGTRPARTRIKLLIHRRAPRRPAISQPPPQCRLEARHPPSSSSRKVRAAPLL